METVRDCLLRHLDCTLGMNWQQPPADLEVLLARNLPQAPGPWLDHGLHPFLTQFDFPAHDRPGPSTPERSARFLEALSRMETLAGLDYPLSWHHVSEVQGIVLGLGSPAPFRTGAAMSRQDQCRHFWHAGLEGIFRRKVQTDAADSLHPALQAARLYLDILFFHPFADGNARAARLWAAFLLLRGRIRHPEWLPIHLAPTAPGAETDYWNLCRIFASPAHS